MENKGEQMKALYKALAAFQQEVPTIKKNAQGYGYRFADLEQINDVIKPILAKHGLGYAQPIEGKAIRTIVFHVESGESIESLTDIPQGVQLAKMNEFQALGSGITYLRRYSLSSMFGLVTDEDADAAGEQVVKAPRVYEISREQKTTIANLLSLKGIEGKEDIQNFLADQYGIQSNGFFSQADANMVIDDLNGKAKS